MRVRTQILIVGIVASLVTVALSVGLVYVTRASEAGLQQQAQSQDVARDVASLLTLTNEFAAYGGERAASQWTLRHGQLVSTVESALGQAAPPPAALLELRRNIDHLPPLFDKLVQLSDEPSSSMTQRRRELVIERLLSETQGVIESRHRWTQDLTEQQRRNQREYNWMVLSAPAILLTLLIGLAVMVARRVLAPLRSTASAVAAIRCGDMSMRCGIQSDDELGDMARALDDMAQALEERTAALKSSERRMRLVTDSLPAFMSRLDQEQRYRFVNRVIARAFGGENAMLGRTMQELRGATTYSQIAPYADRALAGEPVTFEFYDSVEPRLGWYESSYIPDLGADGKPRGFFAITFNVTARKEAEFALAESKRQLKLLMDNVPALISYLDRDRRYRLINHGYVEWHGLDEAQIIGRRMDDFYTEDQRPMYQPALDRAYGGETVNFELSLIRLGQPRTLHVTCIPEFDDSGQVQGLYTLAHDITQLRRVEKQLRTIMEASPLGMFHADREGRCLYVNPAWLRVADISREQAAGVGWYGCIHPDDRQLVTATWHEALRTTRSQVTEHRYVRPDGQIVWVRGHAAVLSEGDQVTGFIGTVEDITQRRQLDAELAMRSEELARSNSELEQFAYVASHDLQEPLRMVNSYAQLLRRRHGDILPPGALKHLAYIEDGGRRAQELITDLLSLARVNSKGRPFEPVELGSAVDEVLAGLRLVVEESGVTITRDDVLPVVLADRRQLGQLLQNLVTNALKFRGTRPACVHVGASFEEEGWWRIWVRDNGIGIDPKFHQRVFLMFQRLHLRSDYPGTGIGLAICKKVVERHGGRIGVESTLDNGSTFWFTIPDATRADTDAARQKAFA
jgi:PAS domain S-box-containing protein